MRSRVFMFICLAFAVLAIAPGFHLDSNPWRPAGPHVEPNWKKWWADDAYNLDFMARWLNWSLYKLGISSKPEDVIIGHEGWLYLGDKYEASISTARRGICEMDEHHAADIARAAHAWEAWLKRLGVRQYRVAIAPDKGSIYPEYLPDWAKPSGPTATDALIRHAGSDLYIDLRPVLLRAKQESAYPLYYKTDTHWNRLGAAYAFSALMDRLKEADPSLVWDKNPIGLIVVDPRPAGDLSAFFHLEKTLTDGEPHPSGINRLSVKTTQRDFASGRDIRSGGNLQVERDDTRKPLLVLSPEAANKKKVLLLRDSFSTALSPYIATMFTEVMQYHFDDACPQQCQPLIDLVKAWKPDYVLVITAERNARREPFTSLPPD